MTIPKNLSIVFLLVLALSFPSFHTTEAARNLLQTSQPTLPKIPSLPQPTLPTIPTMPAATLPPLPTGATPLPKPTLPPFPSPQVVPALPNLPTAPKVTFPPMPAIPNIPTSIPSFPFLSPPPSN